MRIDLTLLHPCFAEKLNELVKLCEGENLKIEFSTGFRSIAEQNKLYAQGRTEPGIIVTNVRGGYSQHNFGIAADFFKNVKEHAYDDPEFFSRVGALAKSIGLAWGGDWTKPDRPHLYLPDWGSTTSVLQSRYGSYDSFKKTWKNSDSSGAVKNPEPVQATGRAVSEWVRTLQHELNVQFHAGLAEDGIAGPKTLAACITCRQGARGNITRLIQEKTGTAVDGIWGKNTTAAVKKYQKDHGLAADGIVGKKTWRKLLNL